MTKEEKILIQRSEMKSLMKYFEKNQLDMNDTNALHLVKDTITRILQLEIEELGYSYELNSDDSENTFGISFVKEPRAEYAARYVCGELKNGESGKAIPEIYFNESKIYEKLCSVDSLDRLKGCKYLFGTIFHEVQHHRQYMLVKTKVSSKNGIRYARDFALQRYLHTDWYGRNAKTGNYDAYITEKNARTVEYKQYLETLGIEDSEFENLRDIEEGKFNLSRYKADVTIRDGIKGYNSNGLHERDDVTVPILDSLIGEMGKTEILEMFPILQHEYNLDGTKKTAVELIKNMRQEIQAVAQTSKLTDESKKEVIEDCEQMYYELIYRQLENATPEQIKKFAIQIGETERKEFFRKMTEYFAEDLECKLEKSAKMAIAQEKLGNEEFFFPSNDGTIAVEQNGQTIQMTCGDFIKTIDSKFLHQYFNVSFLQGNVEIKADKLIEDFYFEYLPQNGKITLINGQEITAKQYIEEYVFKIKELTEKTKPRRFIKKTMKPVSPWKNHAENCERLLQYYNAKKKVIANISDRVIQYDLMYQKEHKLPEISQRKINWINEFITDYNDLENEEKYLIRKQKEEENIKKVVESIKTGTFTVPFDNIINVHKDNPNEFIQEVSPTIARLIKAAENLNIEGGDDYVKKFIDIPDIDEIITKIMDNEYLKEQHKRAEENRKKGNLTKHPITQAEKDIKYANDCLGSCDLNLDNIRSEIKKGRLVVPVSNELIFENIPLSILQKVSVCRVLARQEGKTPSELIYDEEKKKWCFVLDMHAKQKVEQPKQPPKPTSLYYIPDNILSNILDSTIKSGVGTNDILEITKVIGLAQEKAEQEGKEI